MTTSSIKSAVTNVQIRNNEHVVSVCQRHRNRINDDLSPDIQEFTSSQEFHDLVRNKLHLSYFLPFDVNTVFHADHVEVSKGIDRTRIDINEITVNRPLLQKISNTAQAIFSECGGCCLPTHTHTPPNVSTPGQPHTTSTAAPIAQTTLYTPSSTNPAPLGTTHNVTSAAAQLTSTIELSALNSTKIGELLAIAKKFEQPTTVADAKQDFNALSNDIKKLTYFQLGILPPRGHTDELLSIGEKRFHETDGQTASNKERADALRNLALQQTALLYLQTPEINPDAVTAFNMLPEPFRNGIFKHLYLIHKDHARATELRFGENAFLGSHGLETSSQNRYQAIMNFLFAERVTGFDTPDQLQAVFERLKNMLNGVSNDERVALLNQFARMADHFKAISDPKLEYLNPLLNLLEETGKLPPNGITTTPEWTVAFNTLSPEEKNLIYFHHYLPIASENKNWQAGEIAFKAATTTNEQRRQSIANVILFKLAYLFLEGRNDIALAAFNRLSDSDKNGIYYHLYLCQPPSHKHNLWKYGEFAFHNSHFNGENLSSTGSQRGQAVLCYLLEKQLDPFHSKIKTLQQQLQSEKLALSDALKANSVQGQQISQQLITINDLKEANKQLALDSERKLKDQERQFAEKFKLQSEESLKKETEFQKFIKVQTELFTKEKFNLEQSNLTLQKELQQKQVRIEELERDLQAAEKAKGTAEEKLRLLAEEFNRKLQEAAQKLEKAQQDFAREKTSLESQANEQVKNAKLAAQNQIQDKEREFNTKKIELETQVTQANEAKEKLRLLAEESNRKFQEAAQKLEKAQQEFVREKATLETQANEKVEAAKLEAQNKIQDKEREFNTKKIELETQVTQANEAKEKLRLLAEESNRKFQEAAQKLEKAQQEFVREKATLETQANEKVEAAKLEAQNKIEDKEREFNTKKIELETQVTQANEAKEKLRLQAEESNRKFQEAELKLENAQQKFARETTSLETQANEKVEAAKLAAQNQIQDKEQEFNTTKADLETQVTQAKEAKEKLRRQAEESNHKFQEAAQKLEKTQQEFVREKATLETQANNQVEAAKLEAQNNIRDKEREFNTKNIELETQITKIKEAFKLETEKVRNFEKEIEKYVKHIEEISKKHSSLEPQIKTLKEQFATAQKDAKEQLQEKEKQLSTLTSKLENLQTLKDENARDSALQIKQLNREIAELKEQVQKAEQERDAKDIDAAVVLNLREQIATLEQKASQEQINITSLKKAAEEAQASEKIAKEELQQAKEKIPQLEQEKEKQEAYLNEQIQKLNQQLEEKKLHIPANEEIEGYQSTIQELRVKLQNAQKDLEEDSVPVASAEEHSNQEVESVKECGAPLQLLNEEPDFSAFANDALLEIKDEDLISHVNSTLTSPYSDWGPEDTFNLNDPNNLPIFETTDLFEQLKNETLQEDLAKAQLARNDAKFKIDELQGTVEKQKLEIDGLNRELKKTREQRDLEEFQKLEFSLQLEENAIRHVSERVSLINNLQEPLKIEEVLSQLQEKDKQIASLKEQLDLAKKSSESQNQSNTARLKNANQRLQKIISYHPMSKKAPASHYSDPFSSDFPLKNEHTTFESPIKLTPTPSEEPKNTNTDEPDLSFIEGSDEFVNELKLSDDSIASENTSSQLLESPISRQQAEDPKQKIISPDMSITGSNGSQFVEPKNSTLEQPLERAQRLPITGENQQDDNSLGAIESLTAEEIENMRLPMEDFNIADMETFLGIKKDELKEELERHKQKVQEAREDLKLKKASDQKRFAELDTDLESIKKFKAELENAKKLLFIPQDYALDPYQNIGSQNLNSSGLSLKDTSLSEPDELDFEELLNPTPNEKSDTSQAHSSSKILSDVEKQKDEIELVKQEQEKINSQFEESKREHSSIERLLNDEDEKIEHDLEVLFKELKELDKGLNQAEETITLTRHDPIKPNTSDDTTPSPAQNPFENLDDDILISLYENPDAFFNEELFFQLLPHLSYLKEQNGSLNNQENLNPSISPIKQSKTPVFDSPIKNSATPVKTSGSDNSPISSRLLSPGLPLTDKSFESPIKLSATPSAEETSENEFNSPIFSQKSSETPLSPGVSPIMKVEDNYFEGPDEDQFEQPKEIKTRRHLAFSKEAQSNSGTSPNKSSAVKATTNDLDDSIRRQKINISAAKDEIESLLSEIETEKQTLREYSNLFTGPVDANSLENQLKSLREQLDLIKENQEALNRIDTDTAKHLQSGSPVAKEKNKLHANNNLDPTILRTEDYAPKINRLREIFKKLQANIKEFTSQDFDLTTLSLDTDPFAEQNQLSFSQLLNLTDDEEQNNSTTVPGKIISSLAKEKKLLNSSQDPDTIFDLENIGDEYSYNPEGNDSLFNISKDESSEPVTPSAKPSSQNRGMESTNHSNQSNLPAPISSFFEELQKVMLDSPPAFVDQEMIKSFFSSSQNVNNGYESKQEAVDPNQSTKSSTIYETFYGPNDSHESKQEELLNPPKQLYTIYEPFGEPSAFEIALNNSSPAVSKSSSSKKEDKKKILQTSRSVSTSSVSNINVNVPTPVIEFPDQNRLNAFLVNQAILNFPSLDQFEFDDESKILKIKGYTNALGLPENFSVTGNFFNPEIIANVCTNAGKLDAFIKNNFTAEMIKLIESQARESAHTLSEYDAKHPLKDFSKEIRMQYNIIRRYASSPLFSALNSMCATAHKFRELDKNKWQGLIDRFSQFIDHFLNTHSHEIGNLEAYAGDPDPNKYSREIHTISFAIINDLTNTCLLDNPKFPQFALEAFALSLADYSKSETGTTTDTLEFIKRIDRFVYILKVAFAYVNPVVKRK